MKSILARQKESFQYLREFPLIFEPFLFVVQSNNDFQDQESLDI
jgi:hypothetical protein